MPGHLLWLYLPQHLLYNLASVILFMLRGKAGTILRAKRDALVGLGKAWRQRREIQSTAVVSPAKLKPHMSRRILAPYLYRNE
jgi:hypothetical protein